MCVGIEASVPAKREGEERKEEEERGGDREKRRMEERKRRGEESRKKRERKKKGKKKPSVRQPRIINTIINIVRALKKEGGGKRNKNAPIPFFSISVISSDSVK
jgi:hypothetical protein